MDNTSEWVRIALLRHSREKGFFPNGSIPQIKLDPRIEINHISEDLELSEIIKSTADSIKQTRLGKLPEAKVLDEPSKQSKAIELSTRMESLVVQKNYNSPEVYKKSDISIKHPIAALSDEFDGQPKALQLP